MIDRTSAAYPYPRLPDDPQFFFPMTMTIPYTITDTKQITPAWLDEVLRRSGALISGRVSRLEVASEQASWSTSVRLRVEYEPGATGRRPTALFLKMCTATEFVGQSEPDYYMRDYVGLADAPLVPCYDAHYDPQTGAYHILMDDLSASHRNNWNIEPTLAYGHSLARALAALHAHRWGAARLAEVGAVIPDQAKIEQYVGFCEQGMEAMLADIRGAVDPAWEPAIRDMFRDHRRLMVERTHDSVGFTLIHGDVNPGNILSPIDGPGQTYLIDRQPFDWSLTTWLGVHDLAYMMVTWWDPAQRRQLEIPVLHEYHRHLIQRGVTDYGWEQLVADYRLCIPQALYVPSEWCSTENGLHEMKWVWFRELQYAMRAYEEWRCHELWEHVS